MAQDGPTAPRKLWYRLDGKTPVPIDDSDYGEIERVLSRSGVIARTEVGRQEVSTAFLALDHSPSGAGEPLLFETIVYGGPHNCHRTRYHTYDEAMAGHHAVVISLCTSAQQYAAAMESLQVSATPAKKVEWTTRKFRRISRRK